MLSRAVEALCETFWQWQLKDMPQFATSVGVHDFDHLLDDLSIEAFERRLVDVREFLQKAHDLKPKLTSKEDIINVRVLEETLSIFIEGARFEQYLMGFSNLDEPHTILLELLGCMPRSSLAHYAVMLQRLRQVPGQLAHLERLMTAGMQRGATLHAVGLDKAIENLSEFIGDDSKTSPILKQFFEVFPESFSDEEKDVLQRDAKKIIKEEVTPAFKRLLDFVLTRYVTRENIAITSLPRGRQLYAQMIKFHTDSNADPMEIHETGLREVQRLESLMAQVVEEMGLDMSLQQFTEMLRTDPAQQFTSIEELLSEYGRLVHDVTTPAARKLFNSMPRTPLHILVKPDSYYTIYEPGNLDGSRAGTFNVGAQNLTMHAKFKLLTLALHEGVPGHHLQLSRARESCAMPLFRSCRATSLYCHMPSGFPKRACFIEGWGLYAELLGFELGLFGDLLDRFGHYSEEIFRACRLVVDTGIHALGWSRERAIQYLIDHSSCTRASSETEIDRYITCPGQALAYKCGQLKLTALRARAEATLGDKFNVKDFHDVVLDSFGPISLVEDEVEKWIKSIKAPCF